MPVLTRSALKASPLADLHELASTLGIDGYRRFRKADLIDKIAETQGLEDGPDEVAEEAVEEAPAPAKRRTSTRTRRTAASTRDRDADVEADEESTSEPAPAPARKPRSRAKAAAPAAEPKQQQQEEESSKTVEGTVELLSNGSGFVRVSPPEPSDDDVYLSAAQARRCELVSGDKITGPIRPARRSERYASLIRVDTINGAAADEAVRGTRLEDLPADFPTERFKLGSSDPTLKAIGKIAPFGRGSRVVLTGPSRSGKTEAIKRIAATLAQVEDLTVELVAAGVRPEELTEWGTAAYATVTDVTFAGSSEAHSSAVEQAVERGRRIAVRGGNAVLLVDTLDGLGAGAARRVLAAARKLRDGGSLTVIATSRESLGGETTVVTFDPALVAAGRIPAIDAALSGTLRVELLS